MKAELEHTDIESIAQRVAELLKPLFTGNTYKSEDRLLTVKQLSEYTGLSRQWIYNNKKKLQPEYLNGKPLFRLSKINSMLKSEVPVTPSLQTRTFKQQK